MDIKGLYGEALVKALKLSEGMITAITDHRWVVKPVTVKALASRELMADMVINGRVAGELTDLGEHVRTHLMGEQSCMVCMKEAGMPYDIMEYAVDHNVSAAEAIEQYRLNVAAESEDHQAAPDMITDVPIVDEVAESISAKIAASGLRGNAKIRVKPWVTAHVETNELPYDAERIFDMENAALEGADIRTEYEAEVADEPTQCYCSNDSESCPNCNGHEHVAEGSSTVADWMILAHARLVDELIAEIYADDRLMYLTPKGVFVSGEYVNTMRRLSEDSRDRAVAWSQYQRTARIEAANGFAMIDEWVESGKITFGCGDKQKRIIRNICRPHIGPKRKPSGKRRNRR